MLITNACTDTGTPARLPRPHRHPLPPHHPLTSHPTPIHPPTHPHPSPLPCPQDWEKLAADLQVLGFIPPGIDTRQAGLVEPLGRIMSQLTGGGGAAKVNIDKVMADLEALGADYPFQVPPFFALILRAFSVIEGIALRVDPDYAIVQVRAWPAAAPGRTHASEFILMQWPVQRARACGPFARLPLLRCAADKAGAALQSAACDSPTRPARPPHALTHNTAAMLCGCGPCAAGVLPLPGAAPAQRRLAAHARRAAGRAVRRQGAA